MKAIAFAAASLAVLLSAPAAAQEPATVTGRVTNHQGRPENGANVRIPQLSVGATTNSDGSYRLVVPGSRVRQGQSVTITASQVRHEQQSRSIVLRSGATVTQDFQLEAPFLLQSKPCKKRGGRGKCR